MFGFFSFAFFFVTRYFSVRNDPGREETPNACRLQTKNSYSNARRAQYDEPGILDAFLHTGKRKFVKAATQDEQTKKAKNTIEREETPTNHARAIICLFFFFFNGRLSAAQFFCLRA